MKFIKKHFFFLIVLALLATYSLWPIFQNSKSHLADKEDSLFIVWLLNQTVQKIPHNIGDIFNGNIFYPSKYAIAFSHLSIPSALIAYIPVKIANNHIFAYNFSIIFSQVFFMFVLYAFLYDLAKNRASALISTTVFSLSVFRLSYFMHLQMFSNYWFVLAVWFLWKFIKSQKAKYMYLSSLFLAIQFWENVLPIYWFLAFFTVIAIFNFEKIILNLKTILKAGMLFIVFASPAIFVYLRVVNIYSFARTIRDAAHFSLSINEYWNTFAASSVFIFAIFIVFLIGMRKFFWSSRNKKIFSSIAIFSFVMTLGPVLKYANETLKIGKVFIPLPYTIFYYLVPGFNSLRTPSRWVWLFAFAMTLLVHLSLSKVNFAKFKILFGFLFFLAILTGVKIGDTHDVSYLNAPRASDVWLAKQTGDVLLELPMYTWADEDGVHNATKRMVYSLYSNKKLVNGYSGNFPESWQKIVIATKNNLASEETYDLIKEYKVDFILVRKSKNDYQIIEDTSYYNKIWEDENEAIYDLN